MSSSVSGSAETALGEAAGAGRTDPEGAPARLPRLGRYLELQLLGSGGMGAVYRAYDPSLERTVAIKLVRPGDADPARRAAFLARFHREARAMARLSHPNVAQIYDFGEFVEGEGAAGPYFVMEYVGGPPLDRLIEERGPLPPEEVLRLLRQAAEGLRAAHAAGIVHRDVKPANLILEPRSLGAAGEGGRLKVVDFGIARMEEGQAALTRPRSLLGTPHYMAPEALGGGEVDARADLYALGLTAFHLLTGRPPFDAPSAAAVALKQMSEDLPDIGALSPRAPRALCALIARMAEKDPGRRVQSCDELLRRLDAIEVERATGPAPRPPRPPLPRAPLALGAMLALCLGGAAALRGLRDGRPPRRPPAPIPEPARLVPSRSPPGAPLPAPAGPLASAGPRVAVLPFKNLGGDRALDFMAEGLAETALARIGANGAHLVERTQLDRALQEIDFGQGRYVDASTRAALGRIKGAEIAVQGGFQRAGAALRVTARLVRMETGEILDTLAVTRPAADPFALQDEVARAIAARLRALRPAPR